MKKMIFVGFFLFLAGIASICCSRTDDGTDVNIENDILNIYKNCENKNLAKKTSELNIQNVENPLDSVGILHNEVLDYLLKDGVNRTTLCNKIPAMNVKFNTNINISCQNLYDMCHAGMLKTFDKDGNYKSDLLQDLYITKKISKAEYEIINTTFLNSNNLMFNNKVQFIKDVEKYTLNCNRLTTQEKNRILRTFAIYRYSSYYWEVSKSNTDEFGPISAYADSLAEKYALTHGEPGFIEDGKDVYAFAGVVSTIVHIFTRGM